MYTCQYPKEVFSFSFLPKKQWSLLRQCQKALIVIATPIFFLLETQAMEKEAKDEKWTYSLFSFLDRKIRDLREIHGHADELEYKICSLFEASRDDGSFPRKLWIEVLTGLLCDWEQQQMPQDYMITRIASIIENKENTLFQRDWYNDDFDDWRYRSFHIDWGYGYRNKWRRSCQNYLIHVITEAYKDALNERRDEWPERRQNQIVVQPFKYQLNEILLSNLTEAAQPTKYQLMDEYFHNNEDTYSIDQLEKILEENTSNGKIAAAYRIGMQYALIGLYIPYFKEVARYWFVKADKWESKKYFNERSIGQNVIQNWLNKVQEDPKYAYIVQCLYEASQIPIHAFPSYSAKSRLSWLLEFASSYESAVVSGEVPKPFDCPFPPIKVTVIGGGLSGILSSLQLARLKDKNNNPLFKVILLEANQTLLNGASAVPARLHLGGEYPLDRTTALDCLYSALLFWQMIPYGYTNIPAVSYLVHRETETEAKNGEKNSVNFDTIRKEYQAIQRKYKEYYSVLRSDHKWDKNDFFGPPENLYRELVSKELPSDQFVGGILTRERGINPALLGAYLEQQLGQSNVEVICSYKVDKISSKPYGYKIYGPKGEKKYMCSQVINATFDKYLDFKKKGPIVELPEGDGLNVFLRGMAAIDISQCVMPEIEITKGGIGTQKGKIAYFGLMGEHGGMCSPFNDKVAWCFWPSEQGSYISWSGPDDKPILSFPLTGKEEDKTNWTHLQQREQELASNPNERQKYAKVILENLKIKYHFLTRATVIDLIVRRVISPSNQTQRKHNMVRSLGEDGNFIQALSLKAVFAPLTALQVVRLSLEHLSASIIPEALWDSDVRETKKWLDQINGWMTDWIKEPLGINLPEVFRLSEYVNEQDLSESARNWAKIRGLPHEIVTEIPLTTASSSTIKASNTTTASSTSLKDWECSLF